jgi:geranylgeranyl pyrophosphate synthase
MKRTDKKKEKQYMGTQEIMKKYDSINYASKIAASLVNEAKAFITIFPKSEDKFALMNLADYVINREK